MAVADVLEEAAYADSSGAAGLIVLGGLVCVTRKSIASLCDRPPSQATNEKLFCDWCFHRNGVERNDFEAGRFEQFLNG